MFIVVALAVGLVLARLLRLSKDDSVTIGIGFAVRNVALALAIAVTLLNRIDYAVFAAVYFITEVPLLLGAVGVYRKLRAPGSAGLARRIVCDARMQIGNRSAKRDQGLFGFETLLADLATGFVGLPADQVDGAIESAQRRIVEALGLERSSLFELTPSGEMQFTHSWVGSGLPPYPARILAREKFPYILGQMLQGEIVRISIHADLPPEAARDLETFREHGPKSTVVFPLTSGAPYSGRWPSAH